MHKISISKPASSNGSPGAVNYRVYRDQSQGSVHVVSRSTADNTIERRVQASELVDMLPRNGDFGRTTREQLATFYQQRIAALKVEDIALQDDVMSLLLRLAEVRSNLLDVEKQLSLVNPPPIRTIPQELLEAIFLELVSEQDDLPDVQGGDPLRLTQVCSSWRRIAVQLPPLWSRFSYRMRWLSRVPSQSFISGLTCSTWRLISNHTTLLSLWFQRSSPLPVSFAISAVGPFIETNEYNSAHLISILRANHTRIEYLRLETRTANVLRPIIFSSAVSSLTSLKRLELNLDGLRDSPLITAFSNITSLTSIKLQLHMAHPFTFPLRWSRITDIDIDLHGDWDEISIQWSFLMRYMTNLQQGCFLFRAHPSRLTPLPVPQDIMGYIFYASILDFLVMPHLEVLEMHSRELLTQPELRQCFEALPDLECLKLRISNEDLVMSLLDATATSPPLLPNLRRLSIWMKTLPNETMQNFGKMVRSRIRHAAAKGGSESNDVFAFLTDVYIDKTKMYSTHLRETLEKEVGSLVRIYVASPYKSF